jgi:DNA-binding NarL/FixJ family response regulator
MSENISAADRAYRAEMEAGSDMLLKAIKAARNGTCPATPVKPYRLPKDYIGQEANLKARGLKPITERVADLMSEGKSAREIAAALHCSRDKAARLMRAVSNPPSADLAQRLAAPVWG